MAFENDLPPIMTMEEVAEIYRVSPRTIRRMIQSGVLRCVRQGQVLRVLRADFAAMLQQFRADPFKPSEHE